MAAARRAGHGVYEREWAFGPEAGPAPLDAVTESILAWCRDTLAAVRRPWGIDGFDLAIAVATDGDAPRSLALPRLRPADLYGAETLNRLREFLHPGQGEDHSIRRVAVAMFSWGDAAHVALD